MSSTPKSHSGSIGFHCRAVAVMALIVFGCTSTTPTEIGANLLGQACTLQSDCIAGLICSNGTCQGPAGPTEVQRTAPCDSDADCAPQWVCGPQKRCSTTRGIELGQPCVLSEQCKPQAGSEVICHGKSGKCAVVTTAQPGTYNLDEPCVELFDCRRPYVCGVQKTCTKPPIFLGANCRRSDNEQGSFRGYFEIPPERGTSLPEDFEFFRLPYPNNIRANDKGQIDLAGHPAPDSLFGVDMRAMFVDAASEDSRWFGPNQAIFQRFSAPLNLETVCSVAGSQYIGTHAAEFCLANSQATIFLVNIDPNSASYNTTLPVQLTAGVERSPFICQNWVGVAPLEGRPLAHSTTYALIVTTDVRSSTGVTPIPDRDFITMLASAAPSAEQPAAIRRAYDAMAPLRHWLGNAPGAPPVQKIASATVFTVGDPDAVAPKIREAVLAASPEPKFDDTILKCAPAMPGLPVCGQSCAMPVSRPFHEWHGTYQNPVFQQGERPYLTSGGAFSWDNNNLPLLNSNTPFETICFSLAVPKTTAPATGWPVVIYAHGTGTYVNPTDPTGRVGSYVAALVDGTASLLTQAGFVVLTYDGIMHGSRQGLSTWREPGELFFNFANPRASRDNILQGAADLFHLVHLLRHANLPTSDGTLSFDPNNIFFVGHSQGSVSATAFLGAEPNVKAAVFSGAGAELPIAILKKTKPASLAGANIAKALGDPNMNSRVHPLMSLFSLIFAPADAVNFASAYVLNPAAGSAGLRSHGTPLLQIGGLDDSYTPVEAQYALIRAMGIPMINPVLSPTPEGIDAVAGPVSNNLNSVTAGMCQFEKLNASADGHFVFFQITAAKYAMLQFLRTAHANAAAEIP